MTTKRTHLFRTAAKTAFTAAMAFLAMVSTGNRARAQAEAEATAAAPLAEAAAAAPAVAPSNPAPVELPKCECPPPCPTPPPPPPPPLVEWKAQSKGGMLITSGNSQSKNFNFGVNVFRKEGNNKLSLEGGLAYGTSNVLVARTDNAATTITALDHQKVVSTNNMAAKGRYDRFLTEHNTLYASGQAAADKVAGKTFFGGGQVGYSRLLVKDQWNLMVAEIGYDFSYERYIQPASSSLDPVEIHSVRVLVGETLSLTKATGLTASVEALTNLNKETKAIDVSTGNEGVKAFKDTRVNAKIGLSTNLWKQLSFGFSFALKYDQNPAPRPVPKDTAATFNMRDSFAYADKVDTFTEASLIYTFF